MTAVLLTCPTTFGDRRHCHKECCAEYNAQLKERIATHGKCAGCKHWGTDKRRKYDQVCTVVECALNIECSCSDPFETSEVEAVYTLPDFGCVKWEAR